VKSPLIATDSRLTAFDKSVVKLVYGAICVHLNIYFEPTTFWRILFVLSILVFVNLIDMSVCKGLILHEMCHFCVRDFHAVR